VWLQWGGAIVALGIVYLYAKGDLAEKIVGLIVVILGALMTGAIGQQKK
jgi:hypothetical protein